MTFFALFLFVAMCLVIVIWMSVEWKERRKRDELEWKYYYEYCKELIKQMPVNMENYEFIHEALGNLGQLNYQDIEKTSVLIYRFKKRFYNERLMKELQFNKEYDNEESL